MYPTANAFQPTRRPTGEEDDWERVSFDLARALLRPSLPRRPLSVSLFADIYFVLVLFLGDQDDFIPRSQAPPVRRPELFNPHPPSAADEEAWYRGAAGGRMTGEGGPSTTGWDSNRRIWEAAYVSLSFYPFTCSAIVV